MNSAHLALAELRHQAYRFVCSNVENFESLGSLKWNLLQSSHSLAEMKLVNRQIILVIITALTGISRAQSEFIDRVITFNYILQTNYFTESVVCYWQTIIEGSSISPNICTHIIYSFIGTDEKGDLNYLNYDETEATSEFRSEPWW